MPEGHQKHRTVPLAPAVAVRGLDKLLDFALFSQTAAIFRLNDLKRFALL
jgi:hypothetical protein